MRSSTPASKPDRAERRPGLVFAAAVTSTGVALMVGFGLLFSACADSLAHVGEGFPFNAGSDDFLSTEDVQPIAVPQASCPYLRLVSAAATDAGAPWHDAFSGSASMARLERDLPEPLAALDFALGAAIPNVPGPVAHDLRAVRNDVQIGRVQLHAAVTADDYLDKSQVIAGYIALTHASRLVGAACGDDIAPPLPF